MWLVETMILKTPHGRERELTDLSEYVLNSFKKKEKESGSSPGQQSRLPGVKGGRKTLKKFWLLECGSAAAGRKLKIFKAHWKKKSCTFILRISAFLTSLSSFSFVTRCCKKFLEARPSSISCSCVSKSLAKWGWKGGGVLGLWNKNHSPSKCLLTRYHEEFICSTHTALITCGFSRVCHTPRTWCTLRKAT